MNLFKEDKWKDKLEDNEWGSKHKYLLRFCTFRDFKIPIGFFFYGSSDFTWGSLLVKPKLCFLKIREDKKFSTKFDSRGDSLYFFSIDWFIKYLFNNSALNISSHFLKNEKKYLKQNDGRGRVEVLGLYSTGTLLKFYVTLNHFLNHHCIFYLFIKSSDFLLNEVSYFNNLSFFDFFKKSFLKFRIINDKRFFINKNYLSASDNDFMILKDFYRFLFKDQSMKWLDKSMNLLNKDDKGMKILFKDESITFSDIIMKSLIKKKEIGLSDYNVCSKLGDTFCFTRNRYYKAIKTHSINKFIIKINKKFKFFSLFKQYDALDNSGIFFKTFFALNFVNLFFFWIYLFIFFFYFFYFKIIFKIWLNNIKLKILNYSKFLILYCSTILSFILIILSLLHIIIKN